MDISIRKAKLDDLSQILSLVRELAEFEKEPKSVSASLADYEHAFSNGIFESLIAESNDQIVGMALYYVTFSTWRGKMMYLEDFIVSKAYRSQGIGKKLFDAFVQDAKSRSAILVKWQVLDWNERAIEFYKRAGANIESQWLNGKMYL